MKCVHAASFPKHGKMRIDLRQCSKFLDRILIEMRGARGILLLYM